MSDIKSILDEVFNQLVERGSAAVKSLGLGNSDVTQAVDSSPSSNIADIVEELSPNGTRVEIIRNSETSSRIQGTLIILNADNHPLFSCTTTEMPWKDNLAGSSCIPNGIYTIRYADKTSKVGYPHLVLEGTSPRSNIVIKKGTSNNTASADSIVIGKAHSKVPNEDYIWDRAYKEIGNIYGVAGLMGNLRAEGYKLEPNLLSRIGQNAVHMTSEEYTEKVDNGEYTNFVNDGADYGLAQWAYYTRKQGLLNLAKKRNTSIANLDTQLDFLFTELKGYTNLWEFLKTTDSVENATSRIMLEFEKPKNQNPDKINQRISYAIDFLNEFSVTAIINYLFYNSKSITYPLVIYSDYSGSENIPTQQQISSENAKIQPTTLANQNSSNNISQAAVISKLPESCKTVQAEKAIAAEEALCNNASGLIKNSSGALNSALSNIATKALDKVGNSSIVSGIKKVISPNIVNKLIGEIKQPEDVIYDKAITFANNIFLSKDPNDYVAAMMGESQLYIQDKIDKLQRDMASLTAYISDYIAWMMNQIEYMTAKRTFPNMSALIVEMAKREEDLILKVASLQGRLVKEWDYAEGRLNDINDDIYAILDKNYKISAALGFYDPNATLDLDLKSFMNYIEQEAKDIIDSIKNLKDFPKSFAASIDPKDIFYKNFARAYDYLLKAKKATESSKTSWQAKHLELLKSNADIVSENMYKVATIMEKYRHSNAMTQVYDEETGQWVEATNENSSSLGAIETFLGKIKDVDLTNFLKVIEEAKYLVASVMQQSEILLRTPYETLMAELETRSNAIWRPFQELSGVKKTDKPWQSLKGVSSFLKSTFGDKLDKYTKILDKNIVLDFTKKLSGKKEIVKLLSGKTEKLGESLKNAVSKIKNSLGSIKDVTKNIPAKIKEAVSSITKIVPALKDSIGKANVKEIAKVLEKPANVTKSGAIAETIKEAAAQIQEEAKAGTLDMTLTYRDLDGLNRAAGIFSGDHKKICLEKTLDMESNGGSLELNYINDYHDDTYDNATKIVNWLKQRASTEGSSEETKESIVDPDTTIPENAVSKEDTSSLKQTSSASPVKSIASGDKATSLVFELENGKKVKVDYSKMNSSSGAIDPVVSTDQLQELCMYTGGAVEFLKSQNMSQTDIEAMSKYNLTIRKAMEKSETWRK